MEQIVQWFSGLYFWIQIVAACLAGASVVGAFTVAAYLASARSSWLQFCRFPVLVSAGIFFGLVIGTNDHRLLWIAVGSFFLTTWLAISLLRSSRGKGE